MSAVVPPYGGGGGAEATAVRGSYGPVVATLAVLAVLAAAAVAVGRLCFGRLGHDLESWVGRTCGPRLRASMFSSAPTTNAGGVAKDGGGGVTAPPENAATA